MKFGRVAIVGLLPGVGSGNHFVMPGSPRSEELNMELAADSDIREVDLELAAATAPTQVVEVSIHQRLVADPAIMNLPGPDHGYRVYSSTMRRIDFWCACVTSRGDSQSDNSALARCGAQLPAIHARANQHATGGFYIPFRGPRNANNTTSAGAVSSIQSVSAPRRHCRAERRISAYDRHAVGSARSLCQSTQASRQSNWSL